MKYLILGAGPAGLTFANRLKELGETSYLVLEKEKIAGGLCRSVQVDNSPFDIGGGHFLDVKDLHVNTFLFQFMPREEWNQFERNSKIVVNEKWVSHPIEANIWQMQLEDQVKYLKSIAAAGCNLGKAIPEQFVDWIYWKLGSKIADDYMIPYNKKMFGRELNQLGTYWLDKLPNVSFEETIRSCLTHKAYGQQPGHATFYYPKKYGFGELWVRMAQNIKKHIEYEKKITAIDFKTTSVTTSDGSIYCADKIITTIPWMEFKDIKEMPKELIKSISKLKYSSIQTEYFDSQLNTKAHWIYYPNEMFSYHRVLVRHNFCPDSKGYWTETSFERIENSRPNNSFTYLNQYAYPLNTVDKPQVMNNLSAWAKDKNVYGLGRWGEHKHYNSDKTVALALQMAECI